jgi:hypothetical protein
MRSSEPKPKKNLVIAKTPTSKNEVFVFLLVRIEMNLWDAYWIGYA